MDHTNVISLELGPIAMASWDILILLVVRWRKLYAVTFIMEGVLKVVIVLNVKVRGLVLGIL